MKNESRKVYNMKLQSYTCMKRKKLTKSHLALTCT